LSQADDKTSGLMAIEPTTFRANILLAARQGSGDDWPFEEETWSKLRISRPCVQHGFSEHEEAELVAELDVSGRCQRCQMICINQQNGNRRPDSFTALAKLRQGEKGVSFGVHCLLAAKYGQGRLPEPCIRVGDWVDGIPAD
jgi:molybdenum cofactor sulfurtransferase